MYNTMATYQPQTSQMIQLDGTQCFSWTYHHMRIFFFLVNEKKIEETRKYWEHLYLNGELSSCCIIYLWFNMLSIFQTI
jgi:hypothetical protein